MFVQDKVWTIHLKIGAREWDKMQPTRGGFGPGMGMGKGKQPAPLNVAPGRPPRRPLGGRGSVGVQGSLGVHGE